MKILTNRKYKEMKDLITGLQQDYNDLKDKQVDLQLELKYMQEQKELAEKQVKYLQDELRRANDIKEVLPKKVLPPKPPKGTKEIKIKVDGNEQIVGYAWEETKEQPKRGRKPRKEKEDGTKGKNVQKK